MRKLTPKKRKITPKKPSRFFKKKPKKIARPLKKTVPAIGGYASGGKKIKLKKVRKPSKRKEIRPRPAYLIENQPEPKKETAAHFQESRFELPSGYGDNKAVLLVRDPWWIYAYWEVTQQREQEVMGRLHREGLSRDKTVLRVYDVTGVSLDAAHSFFDIEINGFVSNWYIDVGVPEREWIVELGIRAHGGRFFVLVRSNVVKTPRFGVSHILDEEWLLPDELYWKIFGLSGGFGRQKSSLDTREILERFLRNIVSSESYSASLTRS